MHWHNKQRYNILKKRLNSSVHMATTAASTQVHVSVTRDEAVQVADTMTALSGPLIAICQNSPVHEGRIDPQGRNAVREELWDNISYPERPTIPPKPFFTFDNYVNFMLSCETFMVPDPQHPDRVLPCSMKLGHLLQAEKNSNGYSQRIVNLHEGTVWISTRPRSLFGTVEIRVMCQQPFSTGAAVAALILGAVCEWQNLHKVVMHYPWEFWLTMRRLAIREGLDGAVDGIKIRDIAKLLLTSAYTGLYNRDLGEEAYLGEIRDRVYGEKPVPAQIAREAFKRGGIPELVRTFAYC
jgi:gamma-glutamylcysteine synthetase